MAQQRPAGGGSLTVTAEPSHDEVERPPTPTAVIILRPKKRVQWDERVHDTEGKRSSKSASPVAAHLRSTPRAT